MITGPRGSYVAKVVGDDVAADVAVPETVYGSHDDRNRQLIGRRSAKPWRGRKRGRNGLTHLEHRYGDGSRALDHSRR